MKSENLGRFLRYFQRVKNSIKMKRRFFIKQSALASTAALVPSFLSGFAPRERYRSRAGKILVVVQLSGGNDGLNTVVPYRNDIYYSSRPTLAIPSDEVIGIHDEQGLHPAMKDLQPVYDDGLVSIVNSVGYPNPDRSHFRSMDIWQTGSASNEYWSTGWLGRYLDSDCPNCASPHHAIEVDDSLTLALKGHSRKGFAMGRPEQLGKTSKNRFLEEIGRRYQPDHDHEEVAYLYKTLVDTQSSAEYLYRQSKVHRSRMNYPATAFGRDLKQIAELITADTDTRIYYVSLTGFDTHAGQKGRQARLLGQYAAAMSVFIRDLQQHDLLQDMLILTFSEFGRRVEQNASQGTDHGTANNLFLMGGSLKHPGFYNDPPDLSRLDEGDLRFEIDFRSVYTTILHQWLEADAPEVLGGAFPILSVL
jgi:uncharacterized protein (DUF1501 family)